MKSKTLPCWMITAAGCGFVVMSLPPPLVQLICVQKSPSLRILREKTWLFQQKACICYKNGQVYLLLTLGVHDETGQITRYYSGQITCSLHRPPSSVCSMAAGWGATRLAGAPSVFQPRHGLPPAFEVLTARPSSDIHHFCQIQAGDRNERCRQLGLHGGPVGGRP